MPTSPPRVLGQLPAMTHREDIEGLRGLAILPVLIFHFFPDALPLGYLGVDLFFVISGYLITGILRRELTKGTFRLRDFYLRRVRRILPATLVLLVATTGLCCSVLIASDLLRFTASLASSLLFVSNVFFWRDGGYFGTNDELKPLLHTWSLSVEEQFYIFFPTFLLLLFKHWKSSAARLSFLCLIAFLSFGLDAYLVSIGGSNLAFFVLPTRVWQFAIGAAFALLPVRLADSVRYRDGILVAALACLLLNYAYLLPLVPAATPLTLGAGLLLWAGKESTVARLLAFKPLRFVGLVSFSLYLWHWPLLAILRYRSIEDPRPIHISLVILATFVLGWLSWKFVEEPFRRKVTARNTLLAVAGTYAVLAIVATSLHLNGGFAGRHPELANSIAQSVGSNFRCSIDSYRRYGASRACLVGEAETGRYEIALIGNSHAQMYGPAFIQALDSVKQNGIIVPLNECLPTTTVNTSVDCLEAARINYDAVISDPKVKTVVIALTWDHDRLVDETGREIENTDGAKLEDSIVALVGDFESTGRRVLLVGPIQTPGYDFPSIASRQIAFGSADQRVAVPRAFFEAKFGRVLRELSRRLGERLLLPHEILCDVELCLLASASDALFADSNHLSRAGASKMLPLFERVIGH